VLDLIDGAAGHYAHPVRVCFLVHELARSGGVEVIAGHARRLSQQEGIDAEIALTGPPGEPGWVPDGVTVRPLAEAGTYDVAVATWWETVPALYEVDAARRTVLLQGIEHRFYSDDEPLERAGAALALALPLHYLAVSTWLKDELAAVNPEAECTLVPNGVDKDLFRGAPRQRSEGPLRVLVEGQPSLPFKGVADALTAVESMSEPAEATLVALDADQAREAVSGVRVVGGLDGRGMADLYENTDVLVKLSRFEGLGMAPLEAFHAGVPCVLTPYGGHVDYLRDGENGLSVPFGDPQAAAAALDRLARDPALLERLSRGALSSAADWPAPVDSTRELATALRAMAGAEPRDGVVGPMLRAVSAEIESGRERFPGLLGDRRALAAAKAHVEELSLSRDDCARMLEEERARLEELKATRAYRAATAVRRIVRRG